MLIQKLLAIFTLSCIVFSLQAHAAGSDQSGKAHYKVFPPQEADRSKAEVPARVELLSPAPLSKVQGASTVLKWQDSKTADRYHLQVASDPNFKWLLKDDHFVKTSSYELTSLEPGKFYFWRVAPVKSENESTYTKGFFASSSFETN